MVRAHVHLLPTASLLIGGKSCRAEMCVVYSYLLGRRCVDERSDRSPQSAEEPAGVQDMDLADQLRVVGLVDRVDRSALCTDLRCRTWEGRERLIP